MGGLHLVCHPLALSYPNSLCNVNVLEGDRFEEQNERDPPAKREYMEYLHGQASGTKDPVNSSVLAWGWMDCFGCRGLGGMHMAIIQGNT